VTKVRVPLWDNTRFIAIVLVVLGHSLTKMVPYTESAYALYVTIYLFHIPLFVFLSGYFSKADAPTTERLRAVVVDLVLPYLLLECVWSAIQSIQAGAIVFNPLRPSWTLWFLISLASWRILLPYIALLPFPLAVTLAISVLSGYWGVDQTLSLARTLAFLPFFVLGWRARSWDLEQRWLALAPRVVGAIRSAAALVLVGVFAAVWLGQGTLRALGVRELLTADASYAEAGFDYWWAGGLRAGLFVVALVMLTALLVLTPRGKTWFSAWGSATLVVYVLHSFVLAPLRASDLLSGAVPLWHVGLVVVGALALTMILSTRVVGVLVAPVLKPDWLLPPPSRS
jgi:fucose 4-O-acetylase-like acetyltransferase